jgi:uncharacterized protein YsxB (DUF464 family)
VCRVSGHAASAQHGVESSRTTQRNEVVSGVADSEAEIVFSSASAVLRLMLTVLTQKRAKWKSCQ